MIYLTFFRRMWQWLTTHSYLAYFAIIYLLLLRYLVSRGVIGLSGDWPIPPEIWQNIQLARNTFFLWNTNYLGFDQVRQLGSYVEQLSGLVALLGHWNGVLISKYPLLTLPITGIMAQRLARRIGFSKEASFAAGLFYLSTPFFFDGLVEGYIKFAIPHILFPELLGDLLLLEKEHDRWRSLKMIIIFSLVAGSPNHLIIGAGLLLFIIGWHLTRTLPIRLKALVVLIGISTLAGVLLQPTIPTLIVQSLRNSTASALNEQLAGVYKSHLFLGPPKLYAAIVLLGGKFTNHYFIALRYKPILVAIWIISRLPLLFLIWILSWRSQTLRPYRLVILALSLVTIFLAKGISPPFSSINLWLYEHVSLMVAIRNSSYITVIASLCYALLLAAGIEVMSKTRAGRLIYPLTICLILIGFIPYALPHIRNKVRPYRAPLDSRRVYLDLKKSVDQSRFYHLPTNHPMLLVPRGPSDADRPTAPGVNPFVSAPVLPAVWTGVHPTGFPPLTAYLTNLIDRGRTRHFGFSAALADIGHVVLDQNFLVQYPDFIVHQDNPWLQETFNNHKVESDLLNQQDLKQEERIGSVRAFHNTVPHARFEATSGAMLVAGQFEGMTALAETKQRSAPPLLLFADEQAAMTQTTESVISELLIEEGQELSLPIAYLPLTDSYHLVNFLPANDADAVNHWAAGYLNQWWWKVPESNDLSDYLYSEGADTLHFDLSPSQTGMSHLLLKALRSPTGSELTLTIGSITKTINTRWSEGIGYAWFDLGTMPVGAGKLSGSLTASIGTNAVTRLVLTPEDRWLESTKKADALLNSRPLFYRPISRSGKDFSLTVPKASRYTLFASPKAKQTGQALRFPRLTGSYTDLSKVAALSLAPTSQLAGTLPVPAPITGKNLDFSHGFDNWKVEISPGVPLPAPCPTCAWIDQTDGHHLVLHNDRTHDRTSVTYDFHGHPVPGRYVLEFDYQTLSAKELRWQLSGKLAGLIDLNGRGRLIGSPRFAIFQYSESPIESGGLGNHRGWRHYRSTVTIKTSEELHFSFVTSSLPDEEATVAFDNLRLTPYVESARFFLAENSTTAQVPEFLPSVELNPTHHTVTVPAQDHPWLLAFLEAYHPGWQITLNGKPIEAERLRINHFAQAWIMPPLPEGGTISVEFSGQKLYVAATIFSYLFVAGAVMGWIRRRRK